MISDRRGVATFAILMGVMITVIITAMIAQYAHSVIFGVVDTSSKDYVYKPVVDVPYIEPDKFVLRYFGGPYAEYPKGIIVLIDNVEYVNYTGKIPAGESWTFEDGKVAPNPGSTGKIVNLSPGKNDDHLIVLADYGDKKVILIDTFV